MLIKQALLVFLLLVLSPSWAVPLPGLPERTSEQEQQEQPEQGAQQAPTLSSNSLADAWHQLNFWILQKQREFHRGLADSLEQVSDESSWSAAWGLLVLSFLYGVFHAAGPGHGKAVLTTYLMTQPEKLRRGLILSFVAAMLQGVTAILLVTLLVQLLGRLAREAFSSVVYIEIASFAIIALLGLFLLAAAAKRLWRLFQAKPKPHVAPLPVFESAHYHPVTPSSGLSPRLHQHQPGEACPSCGKVHHIAPEQVEGKNLLQTTGLLLSIGLRPCTGAVLVLVVANLLGLWWVGVAAVMAMALGTSITVMVLAVLAVKTRDLAWQLLGLQGQSLGWASALLAAAGGGVLLALGISLMLTAAATEAHPLGIV